MVNTTNGALDSARLGLTLMHEHITFEMPGTLLDGSQNFDRARLVDLATSELAHLRNLGLGTLVDATPIEMGRDVDLLRELGLISGINIVASTGLYTRAHGLPAYFHSLSSERIGEIYVTEITDGIGNSGVRAGVIKVATGEDIDELEVTAVKAAAIAQKQTGVPIITHSGGRSGDKQLRILTDSGADPSKIVIGHVDHKDSSARYLWRILQGGALLGFDRIGNEKLLLDWQRAGVIAGLVRAGFGSQIVLSTDSTIGWKGSPPVGVPEKSLMPVLFETFLPKLHSLGVSEAEIDEMLVKTPARLFTN